MSVEPLRSSDKTRDLLGSTLDPHGTDVLIAGDHSDPFAILGRHETTHEGMCVVRAFLPGADAVEVILSPGAPPVPLNLVRSEGFFATLVPKDILEPSYRLAAYYGDRRIELEDPYRFPLVLGEIDVYLLAEGTHRHAYEVLGAHYAVYDGVDGTSFAVWAPNARRVSVVGDFNGWDGRHHPMRLRPSTAGPHPRHD